MNIIAFITLSAVLFSIGALGVLIRRDILVIFMSVEIMMNAVNLAFIAFARHAGVLDGQVIAFFIIALAAAEAGVGLAILIALFRNKQSVDIEQVRMMRG